MAAAEAGEGKLARGARVRGGEIGGEWIVDAEHRSWPMTTTHHRAALPQVLLEQPSTSARLQGELEWLASVRTRLEAQLKARRADLEDGDQDYPGATG